VVPCHRVTGTNALPLLKFSNDFCSTPKADNGLRRNSDRKRALSNLQGLS
jgi:hypothetical protein